MTLRAGIIVQTIDESRRVLAAMDRKERRVLYRSGSYGRTVMRRTIPRRKKKSARGRPPHAHAPGRSGLKDVRYAVGPGQVVIGHIQYFGGTLHKDSKGVRRSSTASKPVPQLLNEGGPARLRTDHPERGVTDTPVYVGERPFRDPAFGPTNRFFRERIRKERL